MFDFTPVTGNLVRGDISLSVLFATSAMQSHAPYATSTNMFISRRINKRSYFYHNIFYRLFSRRCDIARNPGRRAKFSIRSKGKFRPRAFVFTSGSQNKTACLIFFFFLLLPLLFNFYIFVAMRTKSNETCERK